MLIILSSQYLNAEMSLQLGRIPPAFLPIGSRRLFEVQSGKTNEHKRTLMTLPSDFEIGPIDRDRIREHGIEIIRLSDSLSLSEAIAQVLMHALDEPTVEILFGDTIVDLPNGTSSNCVSFSKTAVDYPWSSLSTKNGMVKFHSHDDNDQNESKIVCGHFKISHPKTLQECMQNDTFIDAFNAYSNSVGIDLVEVSKWYDFGHLATYYRSKRNILISRHFNSIESDGQTLRKTSKQTQKMRAEIGWFETLPRNVRLHTPKFLGSIYQNNLAGYELEYLYKPTLSDLFVFGGLSIQSSSLILQRCLDLIELFREIRPDSESPEASVDYADYFFEDMFLTKTQTRFKQFCDERELSDSTVFEINGVKSTKLSPIIDEIFENIPRTDIQDICFWHGDFFFGNSFFDIETRRVLVVDPRGMLSDGTPSQFGDWRYDLGKLAHSVLGRYDHIIFEQVNLTRDTGVSWNLETGRSGVDDRLENLFLNDVHNRFGLKPVQVIALAASMFFSMLPLHKENPERQDQLLASGLMLYSRMKSDTQ